MVQTPPPTVPAEAGQALRRLVVKDRVHLGSLAAGPRSQALACVWAALPDGTMTEREVNTALRAALAGAACWLDTDHVELRRWLVDSGWLQRDGYGRAYQRVALARLRADLLGVAQAWEALLGGQPVADWVAARRQDHGARRAARRQAWADGDDAAAAR